MRTTLTILAAIGGGGMAMRAALGEITYTSATRLVSATPIGVGGAQSFSSSDLLQFGHTVSASAPDTGSGSSATQGSSLDPNGVSYDSSCTTTRGIEGSYGIGTSSIDTLFTLDGPTPTTIAGYWDYGNMGQGTGFLAGYLKVLFGTTTLYEINISDLGSAQREPFSASIMLAPGAYRLQAQNVESGGGYGPGDSRTGSFTFTLGVPAPGSGAALIFAACMGAFSRRRVSPARQGSVTL